MHFFLRKELSFVAFTEKKCMCSRASQPSPPGQVGMLMFNRLGGGNVPKNALLNSKNDHLLIPFQYIRSFGGEHAFLLNKSDHLSLFTEKKCMRSRASQPSPPGQLEMLVFNWLGGGVASCASTTHPATTGTAMTGISTYAALLLNHAASVLSRVLRMI